MRNRIAVVALAALALAGRAEASPESSAFFARAAFDLSISAPKPEFRRSAAGAWQSMASAAPAAAGFFKISGLVAASAQLDASAAPAPAVEVELAGLLNRQLKTSLKYVLGGQEVWVGGAFDREQNAYVSILAGGSAAKFYNVKALLDKEQPLEFGAARYKMYLAPNVINQMKSEIILENAADEDDKVRITLKRMMDAAGAAGQAVTLGTQAYRAFYTDDVKNGQSDPSSRVFTFLLTDAKGQIHVFIIPADLVPGDKIAVFKMFEDKRVGLMQAGGKLKVYENP